jgi:hypothetical protein
MSDPKPPKSPANPAARPAPAQPENRPKEIGAADVPLAFVPF